MLFKGSVFCSGESWRFLVHDNFHPLPPDSLWKTKCGGIYCTCCECFNLPASVDEIPFMTALNASCTWNAMELCISCARAVNFQCGIPSFWPCLQTLCCGSWQPETGARTISCPVRGVQVAPAAGILLCVRDSRHLFIVRKREQEPEVEQET